MRQLTNAPRGHVLSNTGVWSADGQWIVYDVRSDAAGALFDGGRIERVHVETGEVGVVYQSNHGSCVGVVTHSPTDGRVVFIHGPEDPTPDWAYSPWHRQGVLVDTDRPGVVRNLDARDLIPPFTPGALRGGTHLHHFDGSGQWVAFTYEDHCLAQPDDGNPEREPNQRNVGVSAPVGPVRVPKGHPRNHDGDFFSVLVTHTVARPCPGSDEISRACEEAWVGMNGYRRADGLWQRRAIAFQGRVALPDGGAIDEVFLVDVPDGITVAGDGPLEGTSLQRPFPPHGTVQRRLTYTVDRRHPGIQGPRHWLRSSPDGVQIAFLMRDEAGTIQIWTVPSHGGQPRQVSDHAWDVGSAFTWSPAGSLIAHIMDNSVFITNTRTGEATRLSQRWPDAEAPRPEACVFSPDGRQIAFVKPCPDGSATFNQIFVIDLPPDKVGSSTVC